eukprot:m.87256 g.87256  ORF g.87256 m.87256 type:complete len:222 (+) comp13097_c0_seq5:1863-2528(+)
MALELLKANRASEAQAVLNKHMHIHSKHPLLYFARGTYHHGVGDLAKAAEDFKLAETLEDSNIPGVRLPNPAEPGTTSFNLGAVLIMAGRFEESALAFKRCLKKEPSRTEAMRLLATAYTNMNKGKEAVEIAEQAMQLKMQQGIQDAELIRLLSDSWNQMAIDNHEQLGDAGLQDTVKYLRQAVAVDPNNEKPRKNLELLGLNKGVAMPENSTFGNQVIKV